jgi:hypothetical protein
LCELDLEIAGCDKSGFAFFDDRLKLGDLDFPIRQSALRLGQVGLADLMGVRVGLRVLSIGAFVFGERGFGCS